MKSLLFSNLGIAQAAIGFGWCTLQHTPQVEDFDREKFVGNWHEIYSDYHMYNFFNRKCLVNTYTPNKLSNKNDAMFVERKFKHKLWDTENDQPARSITKTNWWDFLSDGSNYEFFWWGLAKIHHEIIETDYNNYAIAYGCDNWFGGIIHTRWSSVLSRQPFLSHEHVTSSKTRMEDMNYDFNFWWIKSGQECGFDAAPTAEEIIIKIFNTEPNWSNYVPESINTKKAIGFY
jgi:hypothetical protein